MARSAARWRRLPCSQWAPSSTCAAMGAAPKASNMQGLKQNRANLRHCRSYQSQLVTNRSRPQRSAVRPMRLARAP